jgi:CcmD family protein
MDPLVWVLIAALVVWGGLFFYLIYTDNRVSRLERRLDTEERR